MQNYKRTKENIKFTVKNTLENKLILNRYILYDCDQIYLSGTKFEMEITKKNTIYQILNHCL